MSPHPAAIALRYGAPFAVGVAVLVLWQALATAYDVPSYLVPSPMLVGHTLVADWPLLSRSLLFTLEITLLALAGAVVLGVALAFVFVQSRVIEASLFPYAVLLQVTPIVAIAPLIIIWVADARAALVLCATIVAIFPIVSSTTLGLRSVTTLPLPCSGRTELAIDTEPSARVTVEIGGAHFGPRRADARGKLRMPVEVAPSAREARITAEV